MVCIQKNDPFCKAYDSSGSGGDMYNCYTKETWDDEKTAWCCENKKMGCSAPVYDPCADKKEAEKCSLCDPQVKGCTETSTLKSCQKGKCKPTQPCPIPKCGRPQA